MESYSLTFDMIDIDMIWVEHELTVTFLRELVWRLFYVTEKKSPIWFTEKSLRKKVSDLVYGEKSPRKSLQTSLRRKVTEKKSPIWFTEKSHREKVSDLVYGKKSPRKSLRFSLRKKVTEKKSPIWFTEKTFRTFFLSFICVQIIVMAQQQGISIPTLGSSTFDQWLVILEEALQAYGLSNQESSAEGIRRCMSKGKTLKISWLGQRMVLCSLASTSQKKDDGLRVTKSKKKSEIKCFACGEIGHMKFQCKKRKSKRGSKDTEETARKDVTLCSIFNSKNLVGLVNLDAKNKFIADDGASFHVVNDSSLVENLKSTREEVLATMNGEITATSKVSQNKSMALWHERFGHFSSRTIEKMAKQKRVDGLPILCNDISYCVSCHQGNLADVCHRLSEDRRFLLPGFKLHLDIFFM
ncbi:hypothetical protein SSS_05241 [Sarcoptes scabiei]|uniref:CCHC-type domain-containing protein n=1 Tax=Sarcoptes scabiei TaxID=52283 RepID=A0A834RFM4_SARSC|nr:hypothetical protein SSS_05241 [Sarcoptes scabiei]